MPGWLKHLLGGDKEGTAGGSQKPRPVSKNLAENLDYVKLRLGFGTSFDVLVRRFKVANHDAAVIYLDGMVKDQVVTKVLSVLMSVKTVSGDPVDYVSAISVPYGETDKVADQEQAIHQILAGPVVLFIDGADQALVIDARKYPGRQPTNAKMERVLRGPQDGFVETLVDNTVLVRRRLRDPQLRIEMHSLGLRSRTDVALLYIEDVANPDLVGEVRRRLEAVDAGTLTMAEHAVAEFLQRRRDWWNPFPVVRYTERPDVVAEHLQEGHVAVMVDTSPPALLMPVTIFHFLQHPEEYHEDTAVGTYSRWVRLLAVLLSWIFTPVYVALASRPRLLPAALRFLGPKKPGPIPLAIQFIFGELGIDLMRLALLNTPSAMSNSLGFIGAILLGQEAERTGLISPEAVLYTALAAVGSFTTPSLELAMAIRLGRMLMLVLLAAFGLPGLLVGFAINVAVVGSTRSFDVPYLWPLLPFDGQALGALLVRKPIPLNRWRLKVLRPRDPDEQPAG